MSCYKFKCTQLSRAMNVLLICVTKEANEKRICLIPSVSNWWAFYILLFLFCLSLSDCFHPFLLFIFISSLFFFAFTFPLFFLDFPHLSICFFLCLSLSNWFLSLSLSLSLSYLVFCFFSCSSFYLLYSHYICPGHRGQMVTKAFHVNEKISYWLDPQMGKRGEGARGFVSLIFYCFLITGIV